MGEAWHEATIFYYMSPPNQWPNRGREPNTIHDVEIGSKEEFKVMGGLLPHVEFTYNRAVHSTTKLCPFEVVYGFKPTAPIDLLPLPLQEQVNMDASQRSEFVKTIHEKAKANIEEMTRLYVRRANKGRKKDIIRTG